MNQLSNFKSQAADKKLAKPEILNHMKSKALLLPVIIVCLATNLSARAQPLKARIKMDAGRVIGNVDSLLYGNFTEHPGRCIYGGIYDPRSSQVNKMAFVKM